MFLRKGVLNISSKFTGEHPSQSVLSIKLLFAIQHGRGIFSEHLFLRKPLGGCF